MVVCLDLEDLTGGELAQRLEASFVCHFCTRASKRVEVVVAKKIEGKDAKVKAVDGGECEEE